MSNAISNQQKKTSPALAYRRQASALAKGILTDWVGEDRAAEASGRISAALSAAAASAKKPEEFYACTPQSVATCVAVSALTGVMPSTGATSLAYLIPRRARKGEPPQLTYQLSHRGLNALARRSGQTMIAIPIGLDDRISIDTDGEVKVRHRDVDNPPTTFEELRGIILLVKELSSGLVSSRNWVPKKIIAERRDGSDSYSFAEQGGKEWAKESDPWHKWPVEMSMKGLACSTPIPTIHGWKPMRDIEIGDTVFDVDGDAVYVIGTSEIKKIDCYEIEFANGYKMTCDCEHRWVARIHNAKQATHSIETLYEAVSAGKPVTVPVPKPIEGMWQDLPVDPWTLGFWIGDGSKSKASLCCNDLDVEQVSRYITAKTGYSIGASRQDTGKSQSVGVTDGLYEGLREIGVLGNKHIPQSYLRASIDQRKALLCGLVDSDGHISKDRGRAQFSTVKKNLANQVHELVCSLGDTAIITSSICTGFGKKVRCYNVQWRPSFCCATLDRKAANYRERKLRPYRGIKSIKKVPSVPTKCISVDSPTSTYLAGRHMIPTHNTAMHYAISRGWCVIDDTESVRALSTDVESDLNVVDAKSVASPSMSRIEQLEAKMQADAGEEPEPQGEGGDEPSAEEQVAIMFDQLVENARDGNELQEIAVKLDDSSLPKKVKGEIATRLGGRMKEF